MILSSIILTSLSLMNGFDLYYDPDDLTTCVSAETTVAEINRRAAKDRLYFPLSLDENTPIGELVLKQQFTPASFRYGPLADNVLGMNFKLYSGKIVKIGSRVVKNVTGFEFNKFLCNCGSRFGEIEKIVLRLRPLAETMNYRLINGSFENLQSLRRTFLQSSWSHVTDVFDFICDHRGMRFGLRFSCSASQVEIYDSHLKPLVHQHHCDMTRTESLPSPQLDSFVKVKTTISQGAQQAKDLVERFGGVAHGFAGNAFFHFDPEPERRSDATLQAALQKLHENVSAQGGHVTSSVVHYPANEVEQRLEQTFKAKLEQLP